MPSTLVEIVRRVNAAAEIDAAYASGALRSSASAALPFFWLGALLQLGARRGDARAARAPSSSSAARSSAIAVHVDEVLGNQEVVVKNLGPQLSRLPGLAGMTLLASGAVALIYNPVALATLYGDAARAATARRRAATRRPLPARRAAAASPARAAGAGGRRFADRAPGHPAPAACARATA